MLTTNMIGNKIAEARKRMNISQAQLAERLFISPQAVGKWERGESLPDLITLNRLAEILGVDLNYFSENFRPEAPQESPAEPAIEEPEEIPSKAQKKRLTWDMSHGNWADADFSGLKNLHEKFSSSNMQRCLFVGSDLAGLQLKNNNVAGCDFSASGIDGSHIRNSNLSGNSYRNCSLKETEFSGSHIEGCDFSGANIDGSQFKSSYLSNNQLNGCSLKEAGFSGSHFQGCDFSGADFTGVQAKSCDFTKNSIVQAVWNRTAFVGSQLSGIEFDGTLEDCSFENCSFTRVTFRNATILNTFFKNVNLKRTRFIDCRADRLTYAFLKNGKADLSGVTLMEFEPEN
jgi:uncharacterized protein YjbI with pentapeptide repeats/DNA-binding XRE family transcriptional regulator